MSTDQGTREQLRFARQGDAGRAVVTKVEAAAPRRGGRAQKLRRPWTRGGTAPARRKPPQVRRARGVGNGIGTLIETHPAIATQQHRVLCSRGRNNAGPYCEGAASWLIIPAQLNAQVDSRRTSQEWADSPKPVRERGENLLLTLDGSWRH